MSGPGNTLKRELRTLACGALLASVALGFSQAPALNTLSGNALPGSADGFRNSAGFFWPAGVGTDTAGNLYVADNQNGTLRKITPDGTVSLVAGSAGSFGSADGPPLSARFAAPQAVAADAAGNLYIADTANSTIRKLANDTVTTLAGSPGRCGNADGTGGDAEFCQPQALALDSAGNLYVADTWNHTIRKVTPGGVVTTLAGAPGFPGCADGTNSRARFYCPAGIAVDNAGCLFIGDSLNHTIRKLTPVGTNWAASTLAGLPGVWGYADGLNSSARFFQPQGVAVDGGGAVYVADTANHVLRKLSLSGTNWLASTLTGAPGESGNLDGAGSNARLFFPSGLATDNAGALYVADTGNNSIRTDRDAPPWLQLSRSANQLVLSWPVSSAAFLLETGSSLAPGAAWTPITTGVTTNLATLSVTNTPASAAAFFRLHR